MGGQCSLWSSKGGHLVWQGPLLDGYPTIFLGAFRDMLLLDRSLNPNFGCATPHSTLIDGQRHFFAGVV